MIGFRKSANQRGDTLIEVLIAISILSMAVVTAQAVMSYGQAVGLGSVERTATQGMINSQFSYLRYAKDKAVSDDSDDAGMWGEIIGRAVFNTIPSASVSSGTCDTAALSPLAETNMFYIDETVALNPVAPNTIADSVKDYPKVGSPARPRTPSGAPTPGDGIWLLARSGGSSAANPSYVDFYAKACWTSLTGPQMDQATSVLRLYVQ